MSDRVLRFPDRSWGELEGLPQPLRNTAHRAIFHLLEEPVPALAEPFPEQDPLPGAYRLYLPSDGLTIWYTVTESTQGQVVIVVQYVKAEMPGAAAKLREIIALAGDDLPGPFDGEESVTLLPDLDAGARGTMPSCSVPDILGQVVRAYQAGHRDQATALWEEYLPLIHFENRQCGLRAAKVLMHEGGIITSEATRQPLGPLPKPARDGLLELARRRDPLILRWAR